MMSSCFLAIRRSSQCILVRLYISEMANPRTRILQDETPIGMILEKTRFISK